MKQNNHQVPHRSFMFAVAGVALLALNLGAQNTADAGCATADFQGRYAFSGDGFDLQGSTPRPITVAGAMYADGAGKITEWKNTLIVTFTGQDPPKIVVPQDFVAGAAAVGSEFTYTVESDCTFTIQGKSFVPVVNGVVDFNFYGGLANGGNQGLTHGGAPFTNLTITFRRSEPGEDITNVRTLVRRIAAALGVLRRGE